MSDNPYPNASDTMHYELHTAWDEGYAEGFAAGRAAATPDPPEPNAAIRALMAAYNDSQSHAFRAAMVTAAGVIGQHYGDENPNADEFDGAGCCPEEDGFLRAKARAAATPDPPDAYTACVEALAEWWTGEATAAEVTGWMNGALQAARLPELDREAAISMCNMVMADLRGECDYGAVVSNVLRAAYPAATPDPPSDRNIARMFHEAYERLAPEFGYRTREESAVPWEKVPAKNRDLMTATVGEVRAHLAAASPDERLREAGDERPRQTYTITTLPGSGNERKTIVAGSLTEALDAVTRNIYGDPWSDGPNPWVLTFHIARGDVGEFDHAGAVARMKDDLALQEFHADRARLAAADREAPDEETKR